MNMDESCKLDIFHTICKIQSQIKAKVFLHGKFIIKRSAYTKLQFFIYRPEFVNNIEILLAFSPTVYS